jgi:decaprenylphospho-beta-D-erythro-pentofuranosid-2-ulose 2-reductase
MSVLILGGYSAIAKEIAKRFAQREHDIYLAGRDTDQLARFASHLCVKYGVKAKYGFFDAADFGSHEKFFRQVLTEFPQLTHVLVAFGYDGDQVKAQQDFNEARRIIDTNFVSVVSVLTYIANYFENIRKGHITVISSVSGDRGRAAKNVYSSAKGALTIFTQGLRARLAKSGVGLLTVKPGFVDSRMTYGTRLPHFLVSSPANVADDVIRAIDEGKAVIYTPRYWRFVMILIRNMPERIFRKIGI